MKAKSAVGTICRCRTVLAQAFKTLLWAVVVVMAGAAGSVEAATSLTDDRGHTVWLKQPPQRIVSLLPSLTETVCVLGRCSALVGIDRYSNWPISVKKLPTVGGGLDPNIEAIVALKPDLVLVAESAKAALRLESLGLTVVALEPKNLKDTQTAFVKLGRLLGVSQPDRLWQDLERQVGQILAENTTPGRVSTKVYFEASQGPYGASEASFIGEILAQFGLQNILPASLGPFPKINPEFVVRANPDLIMVSGDQTATLLGRPGWQLINAVRRHQICEFTPEQSDTLVRAGPRMVQAARLVADCLKNYRLNTPDLIQKK